MIISKKVKEAFKKNIPVIALESTIITHGMPYPKNVECALKVEEEIIKNGCCPATIGIIKGEPIIGLSNEEIEYLAKSKEVIKVSRRDLPIVCALKKDGGTTVTGTMILANKANIKFFVTGGIGGAHRESNNTFDISSDLNELGQTSVCVICAGPKAILDLAKTLEILETKGVPVIAYNSDVLPCFYSRTTDLKVDLNAKNPKEIADVLKYKWDEYNLNGGVLVNNPIPKEYEIDKKYIDKQIDVAIKEMNKLNIKGKEQTPYLLSKLYELTKGMSLESNVALVLNNARLGCLIAKEYYK